MGNAAYTQLDAPQDITPSGDFSDGVWRTIDVSSYVSSAAGVLVLIDKTSSSGPREVSFRRDSSSSNSMIGEPNVLGSHCHVVVALDGSDQFQAMMEDTSHEVTLYLMGYFDDTHCTFPDTPGIHNVTTANTWEDWDLTSDLGGDTPDAAIVMVATQSATRSVGVRPNGATGYPNNWNGGYAYCGPAVVKVDGSDIIEIYAGSDNSADFYLVGWINSGVTMNSTPVIDSAWEYEVWVDMSYTGNTDVAAVFVDFYDTSSDWTWGIRPDGDADFNDTGTIEEQHGWAICGAVDDVVEFWDNYSSYRYVTGTVDLAVADVTPSPRAALSGPLEGPLGGPIA